MHLQEESQELTKWKKEWGIKSYPSEISNRSTSILTVLNAFYDNLEMLKTNYKIGFTCDSRTFAAAVHRGNKEVIDFLIDIKCKTDYMACAVPAFDGNLELLKWLCEEKGFRCDEWTFACAAHAGHLKVLKWLHYKKKCPWDEKATQFADQEKHFRCLRWLILNGCPVFCFLSRTAIRYMKIRDVIKSISADLDKVHDHKEVMLTIKTLCGKNCEIRVDERTTLGEIRDAVCARTTSIPRHGMKITLGGRILIFLNDPEEKTFFEHLKDYAPEITEQKEITCHALWVCGPFENPRRVGIDFFKNKSELMSAETNPNGAALKSPQTGKLLRGDVVKINQRFYGLRVIHEYLMQSTEDSCVDPMGDPLPKRLEVIICGVQGLKYTNLLVQLTTFFCGNEEYSQRVKELI